MKVVFVVLVIEAVIALIIVGVAMLNNAKWQ
jgi:hypothetical protein